MVRLTWKQVLVIVIFLELNIYTGMVLWLTYLDKFVPDSLTVSFFSFLVAQSGVIAKLSIEEGRMDNAVAIRQDERSERKELSD